MTALALVLLSHHFAIFIFCFIYFIFIFCFIYFIIGILLFLLLQVIAYDEKTQLSTVKFLRKQGKYYTFPSIDDLDVGVGKEELVLLEPPDVDSRLHYFFKN